ncbi:MAG TPA: hypothetical protein PK925_07710 [Alicycliphilus sp.]|nr:hypothetical protein [Alicycliphilus sp.]
MTRTASHGVHDTQQHPLLHEWKRLTQEGLAASRACCAAHAMVWNVRALRVANQLLADPEEDIADDDRLAAFVVAHLNIADCYADMGQPSSAAECLSCAHHKLMALLHGNTVPESLQIAASRQLHQTYAALSEHRAKHGEHPLVERALNACRAHMPVPGALLH